MAAKKTCGIYKITSPSKKVYIGQSQNIEKRFRHYKRLDCKEQPRLYYSLKKHGADKHKFDILIECEVSELNEKERYYQDLYSVLNGSGLNCVLTESSDCVRVVSEDTRKKLSESSKNPSFETRQKLIAALKRRDPPSEETRQKMSQWQKGVGKSEETKKKSSDSHKGKKATKETRQIMSDNSSSKKIILNIQTGIFYNGIKEANESFESLKIQTDLSLGHKLRGHNKNNTPFIYA